MKCERCGSEMVEGETHGIVHDITGGVIPGKDYPILTRTFTCRCGQRGERITYSQPALKDEKSPTIDEMEFALNHPELGRVPSIDPDGTARMTQLTPEQIEEKAKGPEVIVYVSASSSERVRARWALDCIKEAPDTVLAHDWLTEIEDRFGGEANKGVGFDVSSKIAWDTLARVAKSGLLWLLIPRTATMGAGVELGAFAMAMSAGLASPRRIVASGPGPDVSVFVGLADTYFEHDADALKHLYETARELRERERIAKVTVSDPEV